MKISKLAFKTTRLKDTGSQFPVQDVLFQTGQLVRFGSGIYGFDVVPFRVQRKIEQIIREELDKVDCIEIDLPILQPKELWVQSGRWDRFVNDGTMLTVKAKDGEYCIAPTAEEAVMKFIENRVTSYKELPLTVYQFGQKFRNEIRCRGYLNRGKSFEMKDAYSFDTDETAMNTSYEAVKRAYFAICERLGVKAYAVAADNGAMGGKKSEEFMIESPTGEDIILVDENTGLGFNKELLERPDYAEYLATFGITDTTKLVEKTVTEFGHIFQLGTMYSDTMDIKFTDKDNTRKPYHMGCYGIGLSRALGIIYENNAITENGLVVGASLPTNLSPFALYIVSKNDNKERTAEAEKLYTELTAKGISVIIDDTDNSIGIKVKNAKCLGIPLIAIFGDKTEAGKCELETTKTAGKQIVSTTELLTRFK